MPTSPISRWWCRRTPADTPVSTCRGSAPTRRTPTRPSCGWSILYSDEGQNLWLDGYCHPIRYEALVAADAVPQEKLDRLPDVEGAVFPSLDQITAASELITTQWDSVVGVDVAGG